MNLNWINNLSGPKNQKVWITSPVKHGNGGWCGDNILEETVLGQALKRYPQNFNDIYTDWYLKEFDIDLYISLKPSSNSAVYWWDTEYNCWRPLKWAQLK
jgi:hypothetical protein